MISKDKKYRTREGKPVRIYSVDGGGRYPVHGAVYDKDFNGWILDNWTVEGVHTIRGNRKLDLVEVAKKHTYDIYFIQKPNGDYFISANWAEKLFSEWNFKLIEKKTITFTEGEGL